MSQLGASNIGTEFISLVEKVSALVHKISGNRLGEKQAHMIETKLKKRMMELGIKSTDEYISYIDAHMSSESVILVGLITTHHTFFFREFPQFEILKDRLPEIVKQLQQRREKVLTIWSAACSKGHEVYSLAMFLDLHLPKIDPTITFKILGTDIDQESVKIAENGVYHQNEIKEIPMMFLGNHWAKGTGEIAQYAKVKKSLKSKCEFKVGNLLKVNEVVKSEKFDVVFCRNVFIYFEIYQIEMISKDLVAHLKPHGIYFSGISEPLSGMNLDVQTVGPSAYMHKTAESKTDTKINREVTYSNFTLAPNKDKVVIPTATYKAPVLKVMCVDDSSSILTLLNKILTPELGFEIVVTAINGKDAMEKLKTHKVDLMTLDIHMPEMDGVTYLEKNFNKSHPPVMIISSASRADSDVAMKALKYGACDYVEKPALSNLVERGDEIRTKLRTIAGSSQRSQTISSFDNENQRKFVITGADKKMRIMLASFLYLPTVKKFFSEVDQSQPPTIVFFEGQGEMVERIAQEQSKLYSKSVIFFDDIDMKLEANRVYFADFKKYFLAVQKKYEKLPTSILVYGNISTHAAKSVVEWTGADLLLEDLGVSDNAKHPLKEVSTDVVPVTSFSYMSCRYLSSK